MKKKLLTILTTAAFFVCLGVMPAQADKIATFDVLDSNIMAGESFDVEVWVYDDGTLGDLTSFGFDVDTSSLSLFSFDSATVASDFLDAAGPGSSANYVGGLYAGFGNAGTNVHLATLSFTAGATLGTDTLSIAGIFDGEDQGLYYELADENIGGSIDITVASATNPVPEPATMLLFGTGLAGLVGLRRNKFAKTA